jgi:hypothetical protein
MGVLAWSAKALAFAFTVCHAGKSWSFRLRGSEAGRFAFEKIYR